MQSNQKKISSTVCRYICLDREGNLWITFMFFGKPEQFIKTDKWPETPLKNVFPAILLFTKQVSVNRSSFLYNISHTPKRKDFEQ